MLNVHCLIATGVNAGGCREILGIDVTSAEDGAGWVAFLPGLVARGLSGVKLVNSDDHAGLVNAIGSLLPVRAQHAHVVQALEAKLPQAAEHLDQARDDILAFTALCRLARGYPPPGRSQLTCLSAGQVRRYPRW